MKKIFHWFLFMFRSAGFVRGGETNPLKGNEHILYKWRGFYYQLKSKAKKYGIAA